jgi:hypothetical protein
MNPDWQSYMAITVVTLTAVIFLKRTLLKKKAKGAGGCGSSCGCGNAPAVKK